MTAPSPALPALGTPLPDLCLPALGPEAPEGQLCLRALQGRKLVLYAYPRDATPGCTTEARDFSALAEDFTRVGTAVVGLSRDSLASHRRFAAKQGLTITLAADDDGALCEALGVWGEKQLYGKRFMGIIRTTFLVDRAGQIARIWPKVSVAGHAAEVLEAVKALD